MTTSVKERVIKVFAGLLNHHKDHIKPESNIENDLNADSLDKVELVMAIEDEFSVEIADEDAEKMKTVQDVISYIEAKR